MGKRKLIRSAQAGFSLVEATVVVGIIATLVMIGGPKYQSFMARARQSTAKNDLAHLFTLEQSYFGDNDEFIAMPDYGRGACTAPTPNPLGFRVQPCNTKTLYTYRVTTTGANPQTFTATAVTGTADNNLVSPGCPTADSWQIDQNKDLRAVSASSDTANCR